MNSIQGPFLMDAGGWCWDDCSADRPHACTLTHQILGRNLSRFSGCPAFSPT